MTTMKNLPENHESLAVNQEIRNRLNGCHYSYYFNRVQWNLDGNRLTVSGAVPTYYMKQVLQTLLRDLDHIDQLINNVDVISSTGLSSAYDQHTEASRATAETR